MIEELSGSVHTSAGGKAYESYEYTVRRRADGWEWLCVSNLGAKDFKHGTVESIEAAFVEIAKAVLEYHTKPEVQVKLD